MIINCLLIDDDQDDQEIFKMALKEADKDVECIAVDDGIEGLRILAEVGAVIPDFVFVDVNMHKMNGMQVLVEIRKIERLNPVKVIMYSTSSDATIIQNSKKLGADDFFIKPPGFKVMVEMLKTVFQDDVCGRIPS